MIKRVLSIFILLIFVATLTSATKTCNPEIAILNQDPYPAVPGENVEVIFQVTGIETTDCGKVHLSLMEKFPFTIAPGYENERIIESGTFLRGHVNFWLVPFTLRVDKYALDGNNKAEFILSGKNRNLQIIKEIDINVKDVTTSFEVFIRNYERTTRTLTLEIINIGKNNIEALVVEIPEQENIKIVGSNKQTIGILDSNEDTTVRFRVSEANSGTLKINLIYNDLINHRREINKKLVFNPDLFNDLNGNNGWSISTYLLITLIVLIVIYWIYKKFQKNKKKRVYLE